MRVAVGPYQFFLLEIAAATSISYLLLTTRAFPALWILVSLFMCKGPLCYTTINRSSSRIKIRLTSGLPKIWEKIGIIANRYLLAIGTLNISLLMQQSYFTEMILFEIAQGMIKNFPRLIWQRLPKRDMSCFMK